MKEKNIFCYKLQTFSTEEILKCHVNGSNINTGQIINMPKKGEYVELKIFEKEIKSPFILVPEVNRSKIKISFIGANIKNMLQLWLL